MSKDLGKQQYHKLNPSMVSSLKVGFPSIRDAAKVLGIPKSTLASWIRNGFSRKLDVLKAELLIEDALSRIEKE